MWRIGNEKRWFISFEIAPDAYLPEAKAITKIFANSKSVAIFISLIHTNEINSEIVLEQMQKFVIRFSLLRNLLLRYSVLIFWYKEPKSNELIELKNFSVFWKIRALKILKFWFFRKISSSIDENNWFSLLMSTVFIVKVLTQNISQYKYLWNIDLWT